MKIIGSRVAEMRKKEGMTQAKLGQKAFVTKQVISNIERGITGTVNESVLNLISFSLKATKDYLTGESNVSFQDREGMIVPVSFRPFWDYKKAIDELLKKTSDDRSAEILLKDILYYMNENYDSKGKENEKIDLLRDILKLIMDEDFKEYELLKDIIKSIQGLIDRKKK